MATLDPWPLPGAFGWEAFFDVSLGRTRLAGKPSLEAAGCEAFRAARLLRSHYKHMHHKYGISTVGTLSQMK